MNDLSDEEKDVIFSALGIRNGKKFFGRNHYSVNRESKEYDILKSLEEKKLVCRCSSSFRGLLFVTFYVNKEGCFLAGLSEEQTKRALDF